MRERLVMAIRRAIEAVLPWYDPERDAERDREVRESVREANRLVRRLGSYGRVSIRR
jgi:hypothetical protein